MMNIKIPVGSDLIEYLTGFAPAFGDPKMRAALLGVQDNLRQAELLPLEPIGMLACLTAEEEAAEFLYYALVDKKYEVPQHNKLRHHREKVKFLIVAQVLQKYFFSVQFSFPDDAISIERDGIAPKTSRRWRLGGYELSQVDPLGLIYVKGEGEAGHDAAVESAVDTLVSEITPRGFTFNSHVDKVANRRNLCLYGDPKSKLRLKSSADIEPFKTNCSALIVLGFLIFNSNEPTVSMKKLIKSILSRFSAKK